MRLSLCTNCRWQGVLVSWLLRPSQESLQRQQAFRIEQSWVSPIAGVHVRRTDKLDSEANLHQVGEYMTHVERFCDIKARPGWQERAKLAHSVQPGAATEAGPAPECSVHLASDDEAVVAEVKESYSHIHVITNLLGAKTGECLKSSDIQFTPKSKTKKVGPKAGHSW